MRKFFHKCSGRAANLDRFPEMTFNLRNRRGDTVIIEANIEGWKFREDRSGFRQRRGCQYCKSSVYISTSDALDIEPLLKRDDPILGRTHEQQLRQFLIVLFEFKQMAFECRIGPKEAQEFDRIPGKFEGTRPLERHGS